VGPTPQLDVVDGGTPAGRVRHEVVEFEEPPFATPMTVLRHEPAATPVALRDPPSHVRRRPARVFIRRPDPHAPPGRRILPALQIGHE